jgi:hypothetical protein
MLVEVVSCILHLVVLAEWLVSNRIGRKWYIEVQNCMFKI